MAATGFNINGDHDSLKKGTALHQLGPTGYKYVMCDKTHDVNSPEQHSPLPSVAEYDTIHHEKTADLPLSATGYEVVDVEKFTKNHNPPSSVTSYDVLAHKKSTEQPISPPSLTGYDVIDHRKTTSQLSTQKSVMIIATNLMVKI